MTTTIPAGVETARDLVGPAIAGWVDRLSPEVRIVAAYHLGLAEADGSPAAAGASGKALRPALALLSARAASMPPERGVAAAAAVEFVHNFSLLHDDIMDGDTERRHRPTAWTVFGIGPAILAGDALLALAQDVLLEDPAPQSVWASRCLSAAVQRLIAGQGADLAFERRSDVTITECLEMAGDKTAALMACACSIGAIHVGAPAELAMGLAGFGAHAGLAFQLTDDLLGIWGAPEVTGKPVRSDLRARKKSLPVVAALASGSAAGRELAALLSAAEPLTEEELLHAAGLVETAGGRQWAESEADSQLTAATRCLARPTCRRTCAPSSPASPSSSRGGSGELPRPGRVGTARRGAGPVGTARRGAGPVGTARRGAGAARPGILRARAAGTARPALPVRPPGHQAGGQPGRAPGGARRLARPGLPGLPGRTPRPVALGAGARRLLDRDQGPAPVVTERWCGRW